MLNFTSPWMLLGMLLAGIPILIHILNRSRFHVEPWGAMMFLRDAVQVRSQRIRIEQIFLLALRCLFFILAALALAGPISKLGKSQADDATTQVLIIDNSYSMQQGQGQDRPFEQARESALGLIENMRSKDSMLIIRAGNTPTALFDRPSFDKRSLKAQVKGMEPGVEQTMDLPQAIDHAGYLLTKARQPRHRIIVLTDGMEHGWQIDKTERWQKSADNLELQKIKPYVYVLNHEPDDDMYNVAIQSVRPRTPLVDSFRDTDFLVELYNDTPEQRKVSVSFYVDGQLKRDKVERVPAGLHVLSFKHRFRLKSGEAAEEGSSHTVRVHIEDDDLILDNDYSLAVKVRHSIPILLIAGNTSSDVWESDAGMLDLALSSAGAYGDKGLFAITAIGLSEADELTADELRGYRSVILANIPSFSRNLQFSLTQYCEKGGGILSILGQNCSPNFYQQLHDNGKGWFPVSLNGRGKWQAGNEPFHPRFPAGAANGILDIFDTSRERVLRDVRVKEYWKMTPSADALPLAFIGETPLLVTRRHGEGQSMALGIPVKPSWSTFPMTQDFLPLMQNIMLYLSAGSMNRSQLAQNQPLSLSISAPEIAASNRWETAQIITPNGQSNEIRGEWIGDEWEAEWQNTVTAGVYRVDIPNRAPEHYSVSFAAGESALDPLETTERSEITETLGATFAGNMRDFQQSMADEGGIREWWRWIIFFAVVLLCLELFFGWRFSR